VFFFNLGISVTVYTLLYFSSKHISAFFNEPLLESLLKVLGLGIILNSFSIVQKAILTKELNFKLQTKVAIAASLISGVISIYLAFIGCGVWSLVTLTLLRFGFTSFFLWFWSDWRPKRRFNSSSFKELFSFGSKLLLSGLIDTIYRNIYYVIIGKYFSVNQLGYYTRADQFKIMSSQNIQSVVSRVSFPVLSSIQNDNYRLKLAYKKIIRNTMLLTFMVMIGMAAIADSLIVTLIGDKWIPSVEYLQLLCFVGMFYPLHALNLNILKVKGRTDIFLKLEVIKKIIAVPVILIGIFYGIKNMIIAMIINSIIAYYLNSYYSGKLIGYNFKEQVKDVFPLFLLAFTISITVYGLGYCLQLSSVIMLILQIFVSIILYFCLFELFKQKEYLYFKKIVIDKISNYKNGRKKL